MLLIERITLKGKFHSNRKKVFRIPYLKAGVGYFGLAQLTNQEFFSSWLPNFINNNSDVTSLGKFAESLRDALNRVVNRALLSRNVSGFHICGFNEDLYPEFWIVRNSKVFDNGIYRDLQKEYYCAEEFLSKFAGQSDSISINATVPGYRKEYNVNGDIRPFHYIWQQLDEPISRMFGEKDFIYPRTVERMEEVVKWKLKVIASFYHHFAQQKIIGNPVDAFILKASDK